MLVVILHCWLSVKKTLLEMSNFSLSFQAVEERMPFMNGLPTLAENVSRYFEITIVIDYYL